MHRLNILVVIVDYFKGAQVVEVINAVRSQEYDQQNVAITVIDNSCCADNFKLLQAAKGKAVIEQSPANIGYIAAVNRAVKRHSHEVDVVVLLNPDIVMSCSRTLRSMVENFRDPGCFIVGPTQINEDGSRPSIARAYPSLLALLAKRTVLGRTQWGRRQIDAYLLSDFDPEQRQQVPWLQSSCVFVRGSFWQQAGGLDARYFLFMADIVICQEAYRHGGHVLYDPSVTVQADGRRCSEGGVMTLLANRALRMHVLDALAYYGRHFSTVRGKRFWLFVLCCTTLAYGVFRPQPAPYLFEHSDKVMHLMAFGGLTVCSRIAFEKARPALVVSVLLLLAPALEWLQHYVQPAREFSLGDIAANLAGVVLGAAVCWLLGQIRRRPQG
ncbi:MULTISPECIES: glycosyltransferase family 2 protein [Pseudomonas fluorescens group]|uniref:WbbL protein n=1 Tax=Pseudomonas fluorescens TaxID=294 RepID=A0A0D0SPB9_PSEFL|nr:MULTISPECIES: glycosyltransferase [Pseudomonas fluorescens group]AZE62671.1 hypothetical protein C4K02_4326 [Pseudomonas synxantha]KIR23593.1 N-acetylglucosaminyl-diphospho-decaprenol L-rhamnosyltransferase [Pseudomonas fluorescens]